MRYARIAATLSTILTATLASGCATGPNALLRDRELSVQAPAGPTQSRSPLLSWTRSSTADFNAKLNAAARVQPAAAVVDRGNPGPQTPWPKSDSFLAGVRNTRLGSWLAGRAKTSAVLLATATEHVEAPVLTAAALERPQPQPEPTIQRASRHQRAAVSTLPVGIQVRTAPLVDEEDRRTSLVDEDAPPPIVEADEQVRPTGMAHDESVAEEVSSDSLFPDPVGPVDLTELDVILLKTNEGEDLPPAPEEVPGAPTNPGRMPLRERDQVRRVAADPRPIGLPATLPAATYPEDRSESGNLVEATDAPVPSEQGPAKAPAKVGFFKSVRQKIAASFGREARDVPQRR